MAVERSMVWGGAWVRVHWSAPFTMACDSPGTQSVKKALKAD